MAKKDPEPTPEPEQPAAQADQAEPAAPPSEQEKLEDILVDRKEVG